MTGQEMRLAAIKAAAAKADAVQLSAAFSLTPGEWDEAALATKDAPAPTGAEAARK